MPHLDGNFEECFEFDSSPQQVKRKHSDSNLSLSFARTKLVTCFFNQTVKINLK